MPSAPASLHSVHVRPWMAPLLAVYGNCPGAPAKGGARRDVDDASVAALLDVRVRGAGGVHVAHVVDVHEPLDVLRLPVHEVDPRREQPRVVDEDVDAPESLGDFLHHLRKLLLVRGVADPRLRLAARRSDGRHRFVAVLDVERRHLDALLAEPDCGCGAHASVRAGDNGHSSLKTPHTCSSSPVWSSLFWRPTSSAACTRFRVALAYAGPRTRASARRSRNS